MPRKRRPILAAYSDCIRVMEAALTSRGARIQFPDRAAAFTFRHRCYRARSILYVAATESAPPGVIPHTQFDDIFITITEANELLFQLRSLQALPAMEDLDGNPLIKVPDFPEFKLDE